MHDYKDINSFSEWSPTDKDKFSISVLRGLIMDSTRKANSGHPGGPMSSLDFAYILFKDYLKYDPENPNWFDRDRFVLSAGHMSMLQYGLLHFIGWLKLSDLKNFRQLKSKTPGHPEVEIAGVECTTGPLGQGVAMAAGMALSESYIAQNIEEKYGEKTKIIDHYTYVIASDGDMQEPITLGTASLAGHLGLKKLIVYYDANNAQISGGINRADSTEYKTLFDGLGWSVQEINGHDHKEIKFAIEKAQVMDKPSLIIGKTIIAKGTATKEGDYTTHGAPFDFDEIKLTKKNSGLPNNQDFYVPNEVINIFQHRYESLSKTVKSWEKLYELLSNHEKTKSFMESIFHNKVPSLKYPDFIKGEKIATRKAFGSILDSVSSSLPQLIGGSADLEPSNYTGNFAKTYGDYKKNNKSGRNIAFGVREFPMAAMMNGMALHGGIIPFGGTFLVFSDYERPALRLAAIQKIRVIHEFTHDSFYVGEDGPTHQPVEQIMSLRAIPDFYVFRPADARETSICVDYALKLKNKPSALLLTRQSVPVLDLDKNIIKKGVSRGAYIVKESKGKPDLILVGTGSEVSLCIEVSEKMNDRNIRVVSMPCWELFEKQSIDYKNEIFPNRGSMKISIEAGITQGWEKYTGYNGLCIGLNHYGMSAPADVLANEFGFTVEKIEEKIRNHIKNLI